MHDIGPPRLDQGPESHDGAQREVRLHSSEGADLDPLVLQLSNQLILVGKEECDVIFEPRPVPEGGAVGDQPLGPAYAKALDQDQDLFPLRLLL